MIIWQVNPMNKSAHKVIVIGGGITGLSAAYYIQKQARSENVPISIELFEHDNRFGGKIQTFQQDGFTMEGGPDSFLARKEAATELIKELGLGDELVEMNPNSKKTYIHHQGRLERLPGGMILGIPTEIKPFALTNLLSPIGKLRAGMDLVLPKGDSERDESLGGFLRRRFGTELVDHIVEPLLSGIYAGDANVLSLKATFPQFKAMETKYRSLIRGVVAQRKGAASKITESQARQSMFLSLKNGLESLIDALVSYLKEHDVLLHHSTGVTKINCTEGVASRYRVELDTGEAIYADAVIVTTPAHDAAQLLSNLIPVEPLERIPYVSVATILLAFNKTEIQHALDGTGFLIPRKEKRTITACTWASSKWLHVAPEDKALIRCYVGRAGDQKHLGWTDEEMVSRVREDIHEIMGLDTDPLFMKVIRWNQAMPQYLVGHLERLNEIETELALHHPGISVAGAGYYGLGLPDCIVHGQKAAGRTIDHLKKGSYPV
jgi:oxygen-dependent protoporphyrinogen oxidase